MTALVLVSMRKLNILARCGVFTTVQIIALIFVITTRPYKEVRDNIIEIMNEIIFSILSITVTVWSDESMWFGILPNILIYTLTINGLLISLVLIVDMLIGWVQKWRLRKKISNIKTTRVQEIGTPTTNRTYTKKFRVSKNSVLTPSITRSRNLPSTRSRNDSFDTYRERYVNSFIQLNNIHILGVQDLFLEVLFLIKNHMVPTMIPLDNKLLKVRLDNHFTYEFEFYLSHTLFI